jgi:sugar phosphate isomerase/epimerase
MYKNLNPASLGVSGRQSELIELTLTYGFRGLDLDAAELIKRATLQGVEEATKYVRSGKVKIGGWTLPASLTANDAAFQVDIERLTSLAETAAQVGFTYCTVNIDAGSDDLPFHENFERHRDRLAKVGEILSGHGIRLGLGLQAAAQHREGRTYPFVHQAEELLTLIRTTGHNYVGLALDTWNWKVGGGASDQLSELTGDQVVAVTIADVPEDADPAAIEPTQRLLPTPETLEENARLLALLGGRGYVGPVTLMPHSQQLGKLTRDASVDKCSMLLSKLWAEAGLVKTPKPQAAVAEDAS